MRFERPTSLPTLLGAYNERDKNQLRQYRETGPPGEMPPKQELRAPPPGERDAL